MTAQSVTVNLPEPLYAKIQVRAQHYQRSIADEVLHLLTETMPIVDVLPDDIEQILSSLRFLDDAELWRAAHTFMAKDAADRLEALHDKRQRGGLQESERQEQAMLVYQYERAMLIRAHAVALLKDRGYDVAHLREEHE